MSRDFEFYFLFFSANQGPGVAASNHAQERVVRIESRSSHCRGCPSKVHHQLHHSFRITSLTHVTFCSNGTTVLAQQVSRARGLDPQMRAESEVERSAHRETMQALDLSEQSVHMRQSIYSTRDVLSDVESVCSSWCCCAQWRVRSRWMTWTGCDRWRTFLATNESGCSESARTLVRWFLVESR